MTVADQPANNTNVAKLERKYQGESLWADSWRRLRRNRLALLALMHRAMNRVADLSRLAA